MGFKVCIGFALLGALTVPPATAASDADLASCQQTGDLDRSILACGHVIEDKSESDQDRAVMSLYRGTAFMAKSDLEWAILDFDRTLALDPQNVFGYVNRAIALSRLENPDLAANDLRRASEIDSSKVESMLAGNDELAKIRNLSPQSIAPNTPATAQIEAIDCDRLLHTKQPFSMVQEGKNSSFKNSKMIKTKDVYRRDNKTTIEIWKWDQAKTGIREISSKGFRLEFLSKNEDILERTSFDFTPAASLLDKHDFQVMQSHSRSSEKSEKNVVDGKYWGQTEVSFGPCRVPALLYEETRTHVGLPASPFTISTKRVYAPDLDTDLLMENGAYGLNVSHTFSVTTKSISTAFAPLADPAQLAR